MSIAPVYNQLFEHVCEGDDIMSYPEHAPDGFRYIGTVDRPSQNDRDWKFQPRGIADVVATGNLVLVDDNAHGRIVSMFLKEDYHLFHLTLNCMEDLLDEPTKAGWYIDRYPDFANIRSVGPAPYHYTWHVSSQPHLNQYLRTMRKDLEESGLFISDLTGEIHDVSDRQLMFPDVADGHQIFFAKPGAKAIRPTTANVRMLTRKFSR